MARAHARIRKSFEHGYGTVHQQGSYCTYTDDGGNYSEHHYVEEGGYTDFCDLIGDTWPPPGDSCRYPWTSPWYAPVWLGDPLPLLPWPEGHFVYHDPMSSAPLVVLLLVLLAIVVYELYRVHRCDQDDQSADWSSDELPTGATKAATHDELQSGSADGKAGSETTTKAHQVYVSGSWRDPPTAAPCGAAAAASPSQTVASSKAAAAASVDVSMKDKAPPPDQLERAGMNAKLPLIAVVALLSALGDMGWQISAPFLPGELEHRVGSAVAAGAVVGCYSLGVIGACIFGPYLLRRAKPTDIMRVTTPATGMFHAMTGLAGLFPAPSGIVVALCVARTLQGLSTGMDMIAGQAITYNLVSVSQLTKLNAFLMGVRFVGLGCEPRLQRDGRHRSVSTLTRCPGPHAHLLPELSSPLTSPFPCAGCWASPARQS